MGENDLANLVLRIEEAWKQRPGGAILDEEGFGKRVSELSIEILKCDDPRELRRLQSELLEVALPLFVATDALEQVTRAPPPPGQQKAASQALSGLEVRKSLAVRLQRLVGRPSDLSAS